MPDPRDPTPVKVVSRGEGWVAVDRDGNLLSGQTPGPRDRAEALAGRVNRSWARVKKARARAGAPEITESSYPFTGGEVMAIHFDPGRHPRGAHGRFRDVLAKLERAGHGSSVSLPGGVRVRTRLGKFEVHHGAGEPVRVRDPHVAATVAIHASHGPNPDLHARRIQELMAARKSAVKAGDLGAARVAELKMAELRRARKRFVEPMHTGRSKSSRAAFSAAAHATPENVAQTAADIHRIMRRRKLTEALAAVLDASNAVR